MHEIFKLLPLVESKLATVQAAILTHDVGPVESGLHGDVGLLLVMHNAQQAYEIQWCARITDTDGQMPTSITLEVHLKSESNDLELLWRPDNIGWTTDFFVDEADGVGEFFRNFRHIFERRNKRCTEDEAFELINCMAALVAKG